MDSAKTVNLGRVEEKDIREFHQKVMQDVGALAGIACAAIGDRLGLYRAMSMSGPVTPNELAEMTNLHPRYVREWLLNQATGGYVDYDATEKKYMLSPAAASVLADENSPFFAAGAIQVFTALSRAVPRITECFRTGEGFSWPEQDVEVFQGTERMFRPVYLHRLISHFIPAIPGLKEQLGRGVKVADIGCGHGTSTIEMARAFKKSTFIGFDSHSPSVERARQRAHAQGVTDNLSFEVSTADHIPGNGYALVAFFDCLHDMGDPVAACARAAKILAPNGCLMIIEPFGADTVEGNFNAIGRTFSGASVLCCTPNAVATGKHSLGTIAPDTELEAVVKSGGFKSFKRVLGTPFNRVFEAKL